MHPTIHGSSSEPVIVKGGYLLRTAEISGGKLAISGDLNSTTVFEIVTPTSSLHTVTFNQEKLRTEKTKNGTLIASSTPHLPDVTLPQLESLTWVRATIFTKGADDE